MTRQATEFSYRAACFPIIESLNNNLQRLRFASTNRKLARNDHPVARLRMIFSSERNDVIQTHLAQSKSHDALFGADRANQSVMQLVLGPDIRKDRQTF